MTKSKLISFYALCLLQWQVSAQINFSGTDFWINSCDQNSAVAVYNVVRIFGDVATFGNVSIPGTGFSQDFCFNSGGEFVDVEIPFGDFGITASNTIQSTGIHITADNNVLVVMFPIAGVDSDYYIAIPSSDVGQEYYTNMPKGVGFWNPAYTQITATENSTTITITNGTSELGPYTWGVGNDIALGSTTNFTLNAGESVRIQAGQDVSTGPDSNLQHSGTEIQADKPVFVSSEMSTNLPTLTDNYADQLRRSLLPGTAWGNRHFTATWDNTSAYLIQVVSADNSNNISINGTPVATLNSSEMFDTILVGTHEITSTFDVSVVEYSLSQSYTGVPIGDPSSFNLLSESNFTTSFHDINAGYGPLNNIDSVMYMLTVPTSAIPGTTMNGIPIPPSSFTPIGTSSYSNGIVVAVTPPSGGDFITFESTQPMMVYKTGMQRNGGSSYEWQVSRNLGTLNNVPNSNVYDPSCTMVLPVDYLDFTGRQEGDHNLLSWSTQSELNNDYFVMERSVHGDDFEAIGKVDGVGTTSLISEYSFADKRPVPGIQYYRLKQVDYDGTFSYSNIIAINRVGVDEVSIYPNPAIDELVISNNSGSIGSANISVYSVSGQLLLRQEGMDFSSSATLNISSLQVGTYYLEIVHKGELFRRRFLKR